MMETLAAQLTRNGCKQINKCVVFKKCSFQGYATQLVLAIASVSALCSSYGPLQLWMLVKQTADSSKVHRSSNARRQLHALC